MAEANVSIGVVMDTSANILSELTELSASVIFGIGLVLVYHGMDLIRRFFRYGHLRRLISEIIFWIIAAIIAYWLQYRLNYGIIRFCFFLGTMLGIIVCQRLTKPAMTELVRKADRSARKRELTKKNRLKKNLNQVTIKEKNQMEEEDNR